MFHPPIHALVGLSACLSICLPVCLPISASFSTGLVAGPRLPVNGVRGAGVDVNAFQA